MLNSTVKTISYSPAGVEVILTDGSSLYADHALVTFSLGVLQNDDVRFEPVLPPWKLESIHSMKMVGQSVKLGHGIYQEESRHLTLSLIH